MATINSAVSTNNVAYTGWSQHLCSVALPSVSVVDPSGVAYMQIYRMALNLSGKDASRTVALGIWNTSNALIGKTANFTEAAASSASSTGNKTLTTVPLINRSTTSTVRMGFWVSGMGQVYYSADETGQTTDVLVDKVSSTSITTFVSDGTLKSNASLVGTYDYYTLPTAPASISATPGQSQVSLTWTPPSSDGGAAVTSYTLQRATNSGFTGATTTTGLTGYGTTVTGLANGTYYFRIAAVNDVATAASTTSAYVATGAITVGSAATAPSQPTALVVAQQSPQSPNGLALSWTAPTSNGGSAITAYVIKRSLSADMSSPVTVVTPTTGTSYSFNGLQPNTVYYFTVAARNGVGDSPASTMSLGSAYVVAGTSLGIIRRWDATTSQWLVVV
ncbi:Fibronectin type III [uncultured Caudovirales phage]|uniref:Fibronectin type III n=1 Tax=uncultured Caudovirales phage TaxID=2100421 RepID=A0A6J5MUP3_9CAUD|nr:Fibronectin type III [uncultured Caudovirales phage]